VDYRYDPFVKYEIINVDGYEYRVQNIDDILYWKALYAVKGIEKHYKDLVHINNYYRNLVSDKRLFINYAFCKRYERFMSELPF
jgi:hypothetical protein